jgi:6-phosphofructokinase 1
MKIGILTGGGDCPGLNAVIRAVVRKGVFTYGDEFVGFLEGWRGLVEDQTMVLDLEAVGGILHRAPILQSGPMVSIAAWQRWINIKLTL